MAVLQAKASGDRVVVKTTKEDWDRVKVHNWCTLTETLFQCSRCFMIEHTATPVENIPGCNPGDPNIAKMNKRYIRV